MAFLDFFRSFVSITLDAVSFAMIARMILPLFVNAEESRVCLFLAYITEPFIAPVRFLLAKFNILQNTPFDFSFTIAYIIIVLLGAILP